MYTYSYSYTGVDGCRAGWFSVTLAPQGTARFDIHGRFDDLMKAHESDSLMLVDMPIGLPTNGARRCDAEARKLLGADGASRVFPVPCREAVFAGSFREANMINRERIGAGVSMQSWHLCGKIGEVDRYLRNHPGCSSRVLESHPELCFMGLAGEPMKPSKKTEQGLQRRLSLLCSLIRGFDSLYRRALGRFPRKDLARDDILDAAVLALTARDHASRLERVPVEPENDEFGLPRQIVFPAQVGQNHA
jgi:predicted RNase H-like nuclease